jgi:hypothetical protein
MKVIGIRGTNGSGKTYVARKVMEFAEEGFKTKYKLSNGVLVNVFDKFVILGSYDRVCGGCDTIAKPQLVWDAIVECVEFSNVLFEGILVGSVYEPTIKLIERLAPLDSTYIPICLDTEFDQCIANVNSRRNTAGKDALESHDNVMTNYKKHLSSAKKFHADGLNPRWVPADEAVQIILKELGYVES